MLKFIWSPSTGRSVFTWRASLGRLRTSATALVGLSTLISGVAISPRAHAANTVLYWDADANTTAATGGAGTWDTTSSLWRLGSATGALQTYTPNADPSTNTADFGGTAGTVTIASGLTIYANALTFETGGYTIAGASGAILNLSGAAPAITGSGTTTIAATLAGTNGLTQTGGSFTILTGNLTGLSGTVNDNTRINLDGTKETGSQFQTWNIAAGATLSGENHGTASTIQLGALTGSGTLRIGNSGTGTIDSGTDTFQIGALNLAADTFAGTIIDHSATALTAINKVGTGTLTLSGYSTYTGGTTVTAGTLALAAGGGAGTIRGVVTVNSGATLKLAVGDALGYNSGAQVTAINVNRGTVTSVAGNNEGYLTSFNLTGGTVSAGSLFRFSVNDAAPPTISSSSSGTTSVFAAAIDDFPTGTGPVGNLAIDVASGTTANGIDLTISGAIQSGGGLAKAGSGYLNLTGQSSFSGPVTVSSGTLNVGTGGANNGSTGALGLSNAGKMITVSSGAILSGTVNNWFGNQGNTGTLPAITVNGGTLSTTRYTTIGALNLNGATVTATSSDGGTTGNYQAFALRGNVTVGGTSSSTITSTNVTATTGGYHLGANTTFTVAATGSTGPDLVVNAPLVNQSGDFGNGAGGLTKAGAGIMSLNATNAYTGATTVSGGMLLVNGSTAAASAVTVAGSGSVLGGTGLVSGSTTLNTGGSITGAGIGSVGTLTLQSTLNITGGTYAVDLSGTTADRLTISGALTLSSADITFTGTPTAGTTYVLATEASETGTFSGIAPNGFTFRFNAGGTELDLVPQNMLSVPEPGSLLGCLLLFGAAVASRRRNISHWLRVARS